MKKIALLLLLSAGIMLGSSCRKIVETKVADAKVFYKIGGASRQGSGDENVMIANYTSENTVQVIGRTGVSEAVSLMISDFHGVGVYDTVDRILATYSTSMEDPLQNTYMNSEGTIKVTSFSNSRMKGEFQFTGKNGPGEVVVITEGTFEGKVITL